MSRCPCEGCCHDLGGGCCRINLEAECREGGGYEAWEPKETPEAKPSRTETLLKWLSISLCTLAYPLVLYRMYEWGKYLIERFF